MGATNCTDINQTLEHYFYTNRAQVNETQVLAQTLKLTFFNSDIFPRRSLENRDLRVGRMLREQVGEEGSKLSVLSAAAHHGVCTSE